MPLLSRGCEPVFFPALNGEGREPASDYRDFEFFFKNLVRPRIRPNEAHAHIARMHRRPELSPRVCPSERYSPPQRDRVGHPVDDDDELARGDTVGRYVVLDRLGRGAMGAVYAAYDPQLARRVAVKVLRPRAIERQGHEVAQQRLVREAQALAKLSHPHVVRIFDVGTEGGHVFLAMELVEGQSLRQWLIQPRGWSETMALLEQAGRGLAAAHALGLVHRDFKPGNVFLDEDGRVRVGDFGLARWIGGPEDEVSPGGGAMTPLLTAAGDALGTPAYMAPEQHAGDEVGPAADQYAWCVTLFEVLYGHRPFEQTQPEQLEAAKRSPEPIDGGPRGSAGPVPAVLRAVIRRGLSVDAADRFPSMEAMLEATAEAERRGTARQGALMAMGVTVLGIGGVLAIGGLGERSTPCAQAGRLPNDAWTTAARQAVEERLREHVSPEAIARTVGALARRADAWSTAHRDACEDTWVRGEQSAARMDARMDCLGRQWSELSQTVSLLRDADATVAQRSDELVLGLPTPASCARVAAPSELARAEAPEREATRELLARIATLRRAARHDEAWAALQAWDDAHPLEDIPTAEAAARALVRGRLLEDQGRLDDSELAHRRALRLAKRAHDDRAEADAWLSLARVASERAEDPQRTRSFARMGMAAAEAAGGDDRIDAAAHTLLGSVAFVEGDDTSARTHWERALALLTALYGEEHPVTASSLNNLGGALYGLGELDDAAELLRRALDLRERLYGPDHPSVAESAVNLGLVMLALGREDEAVGWNRRALEIQQHHLGPDHPTLIRSHDGLAQALLAVGHRTQAAAHWSRVRELAAEHLPPRHPLLAAPLNGLAEIALSEGELESAEALAREALAVVEGELMDPMAKAQTHWMLGRILEARGSMDDARAAMDDARALARRADDGQELLDEIEAHLGIVAPVAD